VNDGAGQTVGLSPDTVGVVRQVVASRNFEGLLPGHPKGSTGPFCPPDPTGSSKLMMAKLFDLSNFNVSATRWLRSPSRKSFTMLAVYVELQTWVRGRLSLLDERGATAVEYALMVGLIAVAIIGAVSFFGRQLRGEFNRISNTLPG
jgi:pilus assembly protein Flp/PilA